MKDSQTYHIGTSGWHYPHWKGPFYPDDLPDKDQLAFYIRHFATVEINNSFYQLPDSGTLRQWKRAAPARFVFSMKASRFITHMKKLKDPSTALPAFLEAADALKPRLGPLLFQLPPRWRANPDRLAAFLEHVPRKFRCAFEFRDPSWFRDDVYAILAEARAAFCIYDMNGRLSPKEITTDFVYVRLHGPTEAYRGSYDVQTLAGWAGAFSAWARQGRRIYCYFDNDQKGFAARDALRLREMLGR